MFIGHVALGLAAKKIAPKTSLGTLVLSVIFVDVLWPFFLLLGLEHVRIDPGNTAVTPMDFYDYPFTHSLVTGVGWAVLFGAGYYALTRYRRGAWVVAAGVVSHWILDFFTHRPDLPVLPTNEGAKYGLGLWNFVAATVTLETAMFLIGIAIYVKTTQAKDAIGKWGLIAFLVTLFAIYLGNIFGPPPPSEQAVAMLGPVILALVAWPYWVDRHRVLRMPAKTA